MGEQIDQIMLDANAFQWTRSRGAPTTVEGGVVPGIDLIAMLHDAANELVIGLFGITDLESISMLTIRPVLRGITAVFEAPLAAGSATFVGATLGSLSRRSFELRTGVWTAQSRELIAHGNAAFVVVNTESRKACAVPENVAEALRSLRPASSPAAQPLGVRESESASPQT